LLPWRKGPFTFNDLILNSEWIGDLKWQRLKNKIRPLKNKRVLDVGAGNGYFTLRMALEGAKKALGIEPFLLFNFQFMAIETLSNNNLNSILLPLRLEELPSMPLFDSVFSMGVLYHQRDHMGHLFKLQEMMANDSELILETLIVDGSKDFKIVPQERYANMRNVYCLPSIETLKSWLLDAGYKNIEVVNVSQTTPQEQRKTLWIGDNPASLEDFLDPTNSNLTVEGYPAPRRAIIICTN
jgi:tRNA (mo5U34)-methyltransferase